MFRISVLLILLVVVFPSIAQAQDGRRGGDWCNVVRAGEIWTEAQSTERSLRAVRGALTAINTLNNFLYDIKDLCERYTAELKRGSPYTDANTGCTIEVASSSSSEFAVEMWGQAAFDHASVTITPAGKSAKTPIRIFNGELVEQGVATPFRWYVYDSTQPTIHRIDVTNKEMTSTFFWNVPSGRYAVFLECEDE